MLTVGSTGRDSWTRFEVDQHLELLDDDVEFAMRESGTGGPMVKILDVNHATGEIHVDKDLSAFTIAPARHPRVRRWDTATPAEPLVRDAGVEVANPLEEGITVTFNGTTTDTLHAGDYWVIAARTVEGTSETLDHEPPLGVHHHFMKLSVVAANSDDPSDCRLPWPEECTCDGEGCGCDACVTLESHTSGELTIQAAIDQVIAAGGGTVCIGIGVYPLDERVRIDGAVSVRVRGSGANTVLHRWSGGPVLAIDGCVDVGVRDLTLVNEREGVADDTCLEVVNSALVDLERLNVIDDPLDLVQFLGNAAAKNRGAAIGLDGLVLGLSVTRCLLAGASGIAPLAALAQKSRGHLVTADLTLRDNVVVATQIGLLLGIVATSEAKGATIIHLDGTTIEDNSVYGCLESGVHLGGETPVGSTQVRGNVVGSFGSGCVVATDHTRVATNFLLGLAKGRENSENRAMGVELVGSQKPRRGQHVTENQIVGFGDIGVRLDGSFSDVAVTRNTVAECGAGVTMTLESAGDVVTVSGNWIHDVTGSERRGIPGGVTLVRAARARVHDNVVEHVSAEEGKLGVFGIATVACIIAQVSRNHVNQVHSERGPEFSAGMGASRRSRPWTSRTTSSRSRTRAASPC